MIWGYKSEKLKDATMSIPFRRPIPLLDNDVLRTFVAIAETGNFSTAAEAVFRTPSAVSMQIKKLEEQLGATLFLRDARSVSLTRHGEMLLSYARNILALSNEAVSRFIMPELSGVVRLGAPEDIGERLLPSILKSFAESYPGIMVDVTIDMSMGLKKRMEEQRLDLALINCATRPFPTGGEVVFRERLVWAGAKCGSAHRRDPLPISIWEDGCIWRQEALSQLERNKRHYRVAYLSGHTMAQRAAVLSDLAIAPLPLSYVNEDMAILGPQEGLPELGAFDIRLLTASQVSGPIETVADSIRGAFAERAKAVAA
ncbi:LysR family transcriptional regulator [Rhizobium ruizarguesonis]|jgi:DNA-binding transcriptional LysR family regulator|uniref:LysR family transcriptional regulator n=1 Tax=Rhizobium ruizarguesonis TaxID=2081791 RepID=A0ACD5ETM6_9HYPH|nr:MULTISPECIES: LysR family transcriptional regulator [Rhizobium]MBC2804259.1 LysR family transcriptional regulator [Rhizobium ruizarguesonis]MBW8789204.1 LysR family transcriptional regulator [Rhizobium leguminosarum]MCB2404258.1 LysR family transcriptional regulator [Rhizobium ruizarguesonis]QSY99073.1 LysR family transcriptional regulator [Rhizobium ruizarguesonis]UED29670.1 LysR family transcriptional regulator [Rhizobium ruizarguesonis]